MALQSSRRPRILLRTVAYVLTMYNVIDPETFRAGIAPDGPALDAVAEERAQRLAAVGAVPHRRVCVAALAHRPPSL